MAACIAYTNTVMNAYGCAAARSGTEGVGAWREAVAWLRHMPQRADHCNQTHLVTPTPSPVYTVQWPPLINSCFSINDYASIRQGLAELLTSI